MTPIPEFENSIGDRPSGQGDPIRGEPVCDRGQYSTAGGHASQHQQPGQARLHDAQTPGRDGNHSDDAGNRICHQNQTGAWVTPGSPQRSKQAEVVEGETSGREEHCLHPLLAWTPRMRLRWSTRVLSRFVSGGRFRSTRFRTRWTNLPDHRSGASVAKTMAPNPAKRMNPTAPRMAALTNPRLLVGPPTRITGSANSGRARRPPTPRREKAARPPTVVPVSCPLMANIRNCTAAPTAAPPGMIKLTALLDSWDVTTGNQALVLRAKRCNPNVQVK